MMPELGPLDGGAARLELRIIRMRTEDDDVELSIIGVVRGANGRNEGGERGEKTEKAQAVHPHLTR